MSLRPTITITPRGRTARLVAPVAALLVAGTITTAVGRTTATSADALSAGCTSNGATPATVTCTFTSVGEHAVSLPAGVLTAQVDAIGGAGGSVSYGPSPYPGGQGAEVSGTIGTANVSTLYAEVGADGSLKDDPGQSNGGGSGAGYGGGASDVRTVSVTSVPNASLTASSDTRLLVAGGGGGAGAGSQCIPTVFAGGAGGSAGAGGKDGDGADCYPYGAEPGGGGGGAGGQASGGTAGAGGGSTRDVGTAGTRGVGGAAGTSSFELSGGGGGSGYFGGGGGGASEGHYSGAGGGGGGGSSLVPTGGTGPTLTSAPATVRITYTAPLAPALNTTTVSTQATPATTPGGTATDTATISGAVLPGGTMTFYLYGSNDPTCSQAYIATDQETVTSATVTSAALTVGSAGSYHWVASYSGDLLNKASADQCGAAGETTVVARATPRITTTATPSTSAGGVSRDTAVVTDAAGDPLTGEVDFALYGPNDPSCTGAVVGTDDEPVTDGSAVGSTSVRGVGTYSWVATYEGSPTYAPVTEPCGSANESTTVGAATASISTSAQATATTGGTATDTATVRGYQPSNTVTFTLYGAGDTGCSGTAVGTSTATLTYDAGSGTSTATSAAITVGGAGAYRWTASYSGDTSNTAVAEGCGGANETTTVTAAAATISTTAQATATAGGTASDTATVGGGDPTGTVTFTLYGPGDSGCTGTPVGHSQVPVRDGPASSGPVTVGAAGTYRWTASYAGAAGSTASEACGAANETTTVGAVTPTLSTSAQATASPGGTATDTATVTGYQPSKTVTFALYGTSDCSGTPVGTGQATLTYDAGSQTSTATSPAIAVGGAGSYRWTASYSGDTSNTAATEGCGGANETTTVGQATATISTSARTTVTAGGTATDTATVTGYQPSQTVTFALYGAGDTSCTGSAVGTSTVTLSGGRATSAPIAVGGAGSYRWTASYSGDTSNTAATEGCGGANETTTVTAASTRITTTASSAAAGGTASDSATVTGYQPSGKVTFTLYGAGDTSCSGTPVGSTTGTLAYDPSTGSSTATAPLVAVGGVGKYQWTASYPGDTSNTAVSEGCGGTNETTTVGQAAATISTAASTATAGGTATDTATVTGYRPSQTVTFTLYGAGDTSCSGRALGSSTVAVSNGAATSAPIAVGGAGDYQWTATYAGDANNTGASEACGGANETTAVSVASASISTRASAATAGGTATDTATVTGGDPTGTVTFTLYGAGDTSCSGTPVGTSTVDVANGTATSAPISVKGAGSYRWTASYAGMLGSGATEGCGGTDETTSVGQATASITTQAHQTATAGGTATDTATVTGYQPGGTVTFTLYDAGDASCSATPIGTSTTSLADGSATSAPITVGGPGDYRWTASYSGDTDNSAVSEACNGAGETTTVNQAQPTVSTRTSTASVSVGHSVSDTATLSGGDHPSGSVTFTLYADDHCGTAVGTSGKPLPAGSNQVTSDPVTVTAPGTYYWQAVYAGDTDNTGARDGCAEDTEKVVATQATATVSTQAQQTATAGGTATDTATVTGVDPTGTVTFTLYAAGDTGCSGTPVGSNSASLSGGSATSAPITVAGVGAYRWTASYGGDTDNTTASEACNGTNETTTVGQVGAGIDTAADAGAHPGGTARDTATVTGYAPSGTVTFTLYGAGDTSCTGTPVGTSTVTLDASSSTRSTAGSAPLTVGGVGTYRWVARYSGDANNVGTTGPCNAPNEQTTVDQATATISTQAQQTATAGGTATDTATVTGYDPTGTVTFTLYAAGDTSCSGTPVGSNSASLSGGTATSAPITVGGPGDYRWTASYGGDTNNSSAAEACNGTNESTTVITATATISTQAQQTATAGGTATDTATVTGDSPTGTVTFTLYAAGDTSCSGTPVGTDSVTLSDGTATSDPIAVGSPSDYRWTASYGGDTDNSSAAEACNGTNETTTVTAATASVSTQAQPSATAGGTTTDTATVTGDNPTGTVTFTLYGSGDTDCSATPVGSNSATLSGGTATSAPITVGNPGDYRWTASYGGDTDNTQASEACNGTNETTTVAQATPTISTQAADGTVGGSITDTATLGGGVDPSGSVTFTVYAPGDTTCSGEPVGSSTVTVHGDGQYASAPVAVSHAGSYPWVATYSGDADDAGVTEACGAPGEVSTVDRQTPTFSARAEPQRATVHDRVGDSATVVGDPPTGTITFALYAPGDPTCTGTPVATSTAAVTGSGTYAATPVTVDVAGAYRWVAAYSGDAGHTAAVTDCGNADQQLTVRAARRTTPVAPPVRPTPPAPPHRRTLPFTGAPVLVELVVAVDALLIGAVLLGLGRRRRTR